MDRPKPLYTTENIEDKWKKLTEPLNTNNFSGENNMAVIISLEAAKDLQYLIQQLPYERVVRLNDELSYGIAHTVDYNKLLDT